MTGDQVVKTEIKRLRGLVRELLKDLRGDLADKAYKTAYQRLFHIVRAEEQAELLEALLKE